MKRIFQIILALFILSTPLCEVAMAQKASKKASVTTQKKSSKSKKASKSSTKAAKGDKPSKGKSLVVGAERTKTYLPFLKNKRVALLAHNASVVGAKRTVDFLLENKVKVTMIFSPEHGFNSAAQAGEVVADDVDPKTKLPIISLYRSREEGHPDANDMKKFDILIVDLQDVGVRAYTYYVTMAKMMDICAEYNKKVIIFDRPNPNGMYVDGPILDMKYKSGVGYFPIPYVHGMTLGELAKMINGEGWLTGTRQVDLVVIPCENYTHQTVYDCPIAPSPNLPNALSVALYPSLCLFEGTPMSVGRGTEKAFQCFGHPNMGSDYQFTFTPKTDHLKDKLCYGMDLTGTPISMARQKGLNLNFVITAYNAMNLGNFFFSPFFEKVIGVDYVRKMILQGKSADEIASMWVQDVEEFKERRKPYLLYK